jgi:hypothetical protein
MIKMMILAILGMKIVKIAKSTKTAQSFSKHNKIFREITQRRRISSIFLLRRDLALY